MADHSNKFLKQLLQGMTLVSQLHAEALGGVAIPKGLIKGHTAYFYGNREVSGFSDSIIRFRFVNDNGKDPYKDPSEDRHLRGLKISVWDLERRGWRTQDTVFFEEVWQDAVWRLPTGELVETPRNFNMRSLSGVGVWEPSEPSNREIVILALEMLPLLFPEKDKRHDLFPEAGLTFRKFEPIAVTNSERKDLAMLIQSGIFNQPETDRDDRT